jgi:hypothetical protein
MRCSTGESAKCELGARTANLSRPNLSHSIHVETNRDSTDRSAFFVLPERNESVATDQSIRRPHATRASRSPIESLVTWAVESSRILRHERDAIAWIVACVEHWLQATTDYPQRRFPVVNQRLGTKDKAADVCSVEPPPIRVSAPRRYASAPGPTRGTLDESPC